jgi:glycerol-3-phosphate dehydrogenase
MRLYEKVLLDPSLAKEVVPGVPVAELVHAVEIEDAMTADDFLLRRTKLYLTLSAQEREAVGRWFSG